MSYNPVPKLTNGNATFNNDVNVSGLSTAGSGLLLVDLVPDSTTNKLYNDGGTLKFNGSSIGGTGSSSLTVRDVDGTPSISNVTTIEVTNGSLTDQGGGVVRIATSGGGVAGGSFTSGSGLTLVGSEFNVYGGSGNFEHLELTTDNNIVPKLKFLGSGIHDTPINLEVRSSLQSATGSGTALLFQGTQGQLFSITDNLSSGVIFNVSDITGLPMLEITASGDVEIGEFADTITVHQPILLSGGVPTDTTNKLYNDAGTLKFNGSTVGGSGSSSYTAGSGLTLAGTEFNVYGGSGHFANLEIKPNAATDTGLVVQGAVSQAANLQEWQNSSENTLAHVDSSGVYTNIIGTSGTDTLRVKYGTPLHDHDGSSGADVTGVWLDYEDGSEYSTTINTNALIIGTWYNTAKTVESRIRISATAFNLKLAGSSKIDCQSSTTKFNTDVTPWSSSSTVDLGSESVPWTNVYASGATVSGVELINHVPADTTNRLYNDAGTLKFNGSSIGGTGSSSLTVRDVDGTPSISNVTTIEVTNGSLTDQGGGVVRIATSGGGVAGGSFTSGSGLTLVGSEFNVYGGSGNFEHLELTTDNNIVPKLKFLGSGIHDTPINLEVRSSLQSATGSGTALLFQGTQGQLFSITDNLSSGVIFNVSDITGLPMLEITASGDVEIGEFADTITVHQPILLSGGVPTDTTNKLYNDAGTLKFNGSTVGGSGSSSYTAGSGLTLAGTEFNVYGGSGHFANLEIKPNAATDTGLVVQGAVSQAANLQEWQNSSENTLAHVDSSGVYTNIIGTSGTDTLRVKYGTPLHDHDGSSGADVTGVWLDYEDGSEYSTTINTNALIIGTWYNTAKTVESRIRISATAFNLKLAGSSKIDCQSSTTKFNTDVTPWSSSSTVDLGSESVPWTNVYASGATVSGVELLNHVPADTTNRLYNEGGTLKFNGSTVGGSSSLTAGSGLVLVGTEFNVHGGSGHFINLDVEGAFTATTKSFLIDHPSKEGMKLQYASLEGPENGVYVRGTTRQGFITLPDYWKDLVDNDSITVTLTPIGQFQPIFVKQKNNREIRVGGVCGDYDYVVWGERKDVNKLEVEW